MKRTDLFTIDTRTGNTDICAVIRMVRWLPGVVWSDLANLETGTGHKQKAYAKSRPVEFTVRYGRCLLYRCYCG
jgi:hypothetical protein